MENENGFANITQREMLAGFAIAVTALAISKVTGLEAAPSAPTFTPIESAKVSFSVNGEAVNIEVDTRTTLLDGLREQLHLIGTKNG